MIGIVEAKDSNENSNRRHSRNDSVRNGAQQEPVISCPLGMQNDNTTADVSMSSTNETASKLARSAYHDHFGSSEDILEWPVFQGRYDRRWIEARIFDPTLPCDDLYGTSHTPSFTEDSTPAKCGIARQNYSTGPGVREEDVPQLIDTFLVNVHVKNPIFDPEYLRKMARSVVDDGFDWKAPSCLVVSMIYL